MEQHQVSKEPHASSHNMLSSICPVCGHRSGWWPSYPVSSFSSVQQPNSAPPAHPACSDLPEFVFYAVILITFLLAVIKHLTKATQGRKEGPRLILTLTARLLSITVDESQEQEHEGVSHFVSLVKKQRTASTCYLVHNLGSQPLRSPTSMNQIFSSQGMQSR